MSKMNFTELLSRSNGSVKLLSNGKQLLLNSKYMRKHGFQYLIRGNNEFAGVVLIRKKVLDDSSGQRKEVAVVLRPDGTVEEESLCIFDNRMQSYVDITYDLGDIFLLTGKTSPEDTMNLMNWLPPADAQPISDLKNYIKDLEIGHREISNHAEEVEHSLKMERLIAKQSQEIVVSLEGQLNELSQKYTSLYSVQRRAEARALNYQSQSSALKGHINELNSTMIKVASDAGKDPYKVAMEVLKHTQALYEAVETITDDRHQTIRDDISVVLSQLDATKERIKNSEKQLSQLKKQGKQIVDVDKKNEQERHTPDLE